jgi:hypothetical protein
LGYSFNYQCLFLNLYSSIVPSTINLLSSKTLRGSSADYYLTLLVLTGASLVTVLSSSSDCYTLTDLNLLVS